MDEHTQRPVRTRTRELNAREHRGVLRRGTIGQLAVAGPGLTIIPVAYGLDDGDLVLRSTQRRHHATLISHVSASVAVDERDVDGGGRFVVARGRLEPVLDAVEVVRLERLRVAHWATWHQPGGWLRLVVEEISGHELQGLADAVA